MALHWEFAFRGLLVAVEHSHRRQPFFYLPFLSSLFFLSSMYIEKGRVFLKCCFFRIVFVLAVADWPIR
jgi:hypothetical protein